ncbi:MAG: 30S ribosomal protein S8 [Amoebophilaceae bacterium TMED152]|nr:MAG: 30S ribosomal protein S8 [Amoebophilaceae bacterium TMED152]|tara:strand:+ start:4843 stop:5241 length:399 start_codon:yes stop_codon:yes gene_type:complete
MNTDTIADFLTRIRNAIQANHRIVEIPASNMKKEITKVLHEKGFILNYKFEDEGPQGIIKIALKYNPRTKQSAIEKIRRISKPGLRKYVGFDSLPRVINGLGIAILSTSKGVITDKEARKLKIGGEVLCYVY